MNTSQLTQTTVRLVYPPAPTDPSIPASIFCLEIDETLEVEWQWTNLPDGNRVVTNYKLCPRRDKFCEVEA